MSQLKITRTSEKCTSDLTADSNEIKTEESYFCLHISVPINMCNIIDMTATGINLTQLGLFTYKEKMRIENLKTTLQKL